MTHSALPVLSMELGRSNQWYLSVYSSINLSKICIFYIFKSIFVFIVTYLHNECVHAIKIFACLQKGIFFLSPSLPIYLSVCLSVTTSTCPLNLRIYRSGREYQNRQSMCSSVLVLQQERKARESGRPSSSGSVTSLWPFHVRWSVGCLVGLS